MAEEIDPWLAAPIRKNVVLDGLTYTLEARQVSEGWFCSWRCETCQAVGAHSGTTRTSAAAIRLAKQNLQSHHRDSHQRDSHQKAK
jgi:hypothetical protein